MADEAPVTVGVFYRYGYKGRDMLAIRAPFTASGDTALVGRRLRVFGDIFEVKSVLRQVSGAIQKGEPIGVEVSPAKVHE